MRINSAGSVAQAAQQAALRARTPGSVSVGPRQGSAGGQFRVMDRRDAGLAQSAQNPHGFAQSEGSPGPAQNAAARQGIQALRTTGAGGSAISGTYGQQHIDAIMASWGATAGEERFQIAADADGSGTVDFRDVTFVQANWGKKAPQIPSSTPDSAPRTYGQQNIDAALKAFGTFKGGDRYSATADADANGVVDFKDITFVQTNWGRTIATA